jgi:hypothetical protein
MKRFIIFTALLLGLILFASFGGFSQTTINDTSKFDTTKVKTESFACAGLVSQYVWRGVMLDNRPNIQPLLSLKRGGLEIGTLGSLSLMNDYYEVDLYASYSYKFFKLCVTDFYIDLSKGIYQQRYTNYTTGACYHNVIADLVIPPMNKFPFKLTLSTILYGGLDVTSNGNGKYTTYAEARFIKKEWEVFVGGISGGSSFYMNDGKNAGVINLGAVYNYSICKLPSTVQFCANPQIEKIYLTFSVTF